MVGSSAKSLVMLLSVSSSKFVSGIRSTISVNSSILSIFSKLPHEDATKSDLESFLFLAKVKSSFREKGPQT